MRSRLLTGGVPHPSRRALREVRRDSRQHPTLTLVRWIVGTIVLVVGVLGIVLPLTPAIVLIPAGVAIAGRDCLMVRWGRASTKLLLRRAETWPGWLGTLGRMAAAAERRFAAKMRHRRMSRVEGTPAKAPA
jgi:hypothetical protein